MRQYPREMLEIRLFQISPLLVSRFCSSHLPRNSLQEVGSRRKPCVISHQCDKALIEYQFGDIPITFGGRNENWSVEWVCSGTGHYLLIILIEHERVGHYLPCMLVLCPTLRISILTNSCWMPEITQYPPPWACNMGCVRVFQHIFLDFDAIGPPFHIFSWRLIYQGVPSA